jgi:hypothetical protein
LVGRSEPNRLRIARFRLNVDQMSWVFADALTPPGLGQLRGHLFGSQQILTGIRGASQSGTSGCDEGTSNVSLLEAQSTDKDPPC